MRVIYPLSVYVRFPFLEPRLFFSPLPTLSRKRYVYGQEGAMKRRYALTSAREKRVSGVVWP